MEFQFSKEINASLYETDGLINDVPLRMHLDETKEIKGAVRAQRDWSEQVHPIDGYKGGLGELYTFMRVTVPECRPERLEIISYANEFAFLYDDRMESFDLKSHSSEATGFLDTFGNGALNSTVASDDRPEKRLQARMLKEMMKIDPQRALTSMKAWAEFVQSASRTRTQPFETLEEYIPSRVIDAGELIWFGTLTFGMALTIPEEEYELCHKLAKPGYAALGLANDLYSWKKERAAAEDAGEDYVFNAIWVIMKERGVTEAEAIEVCRGEILRYISAYCKIVDATRDDPNLSKDLRAYIEAVMFSYSGNLVWSIYCPRYKGY